MTDRAGYWAKAEERLIRAYTIDKTLETPVNFIVHSLHEVNDSLAHGRVFFIEVKHDGIALYEGDDGELATPKPKTPQQALTVAKEYFEENGSGAASFFRGYTDARKHAGPILPIPRDDITASWRSLVYLHGVYLHGRLGGPSQQLVLISADFGRAYLTEGWAARFVVRLFADFTVLFLGYSLNDPVLRYMTDTFAAGHTQRRPGNLAFPKTDFGSVYQSRRGPLHSALRVYDVMDSVAGSCSKCPTPSCCIARLRRQRDLVLRLLRSGMCSKLTLVWLSSALHQFLPTARTASPNVIGEAYRRH